MKLNLIPNTGGIAASMSAMTSHIKTSNISSNFEKLLDAFKFGLFRG
jgi:hypothetical protein